MICESKSVLRQMTAYKLRYSECPLCDMPFTRRNDLERHIGSAHPQFLSEFIC